MAFTRDLDRTANALERLSQQFRDKTRMRQVVTAFVDEAASLETVFQDVFDSMNIETATNAQLDIWGEILNVARNGQTDLVYRVRIKAALFRYVSSGKWEEVIQGFKILTNPQYVQAEEIFPAAVSLTAIGLADPTSLPAAELIAALQQLKPAAVRLTAVIVTSSTPFVFFGDPDVNGLGLGDQLNPAYGGNLADRLII